MSERIVIALPSTEQVKAVELAKELYLAVAERGRFQGVGTRSNVLCEQLAEMIALAVQRSAVLAVQDGNGKPVPSPNGKLGSKAS